MNMPKKPTGKAADHVAQHVEFSDDAFADFTESQNGILNDLAEQTDALSAYTDSLEIDIALTGGDDQDDEYGIDSLFSGDGNDDDDLFGESELEIDDLFAV